MVKYLIIGYDAT